MPYPLPDEPALDDLRWLIVAIPGGPDDAQIEYRRAALGAYTEMANRFMWGLEGLEAGSDDASQAWEAAIAATLEALEMNFPQLLLSHIDEVEAKLDALILCCGLGAGGTSPYISDNPPTVTSNIIPGVGDHPAMWGDEEIADWDEYEELLCGAAHDYVDLLVSSAWDFSAAVQGATIVLSFIAAVMAALTGAGVLLAVGYGAVAAAFTSLSGLLGSTVFVDAAGELEAARGDIVCAIVQGISPAASIGGAVNPIAFAAVYQWINYENALATMLNGGNESGNLTPRLGEDCSTCFPPPFYVDVLQGVPLGDGLYRSTPLAGSSARVQVVLYTDSSKTTPYTGSITASDDSAYNTRISANPVYRVFAIGVTPPVYSSNTVYPVDIEGYGILVVHSGTSDFTIRIAIEEP